MRAFVKLDFEVVGFHQYEGAPKEVRFLACRHRHIFNIKIKYLVTDLDREKEIFIQTDLVKDYLHRRYGTPCEFRNMSCEMIAKEIIEWGQEDGLVFVEVLEDNKGGAIVEL